MTSPRAPRLIKPFCVFSCDPGGTSGIATAWYEGQKDADNPPTLEDFHIETSQLGPEEHHAALSHVIDSHFLTLTTLAPFTILTESFEFRQNIRADGAKHKVELISKEYIGVMKLIAQEYDCKYVEQTASQGKGFVPNEKLDLCGILVTPQHPNRHKNDALRHLIRHLVVGLGIRAPITNHWK